VSGDQPPPPGWQPPAAPPPGWQPARPPVASYAGQVPPPYPAAGYVPQPGMLGAAHKPGAIPLRPLVLGDILDGAFRIIRYNPKATIGAAVLVSAVAMIVPITVGLVTGSTGGFHFDAAGGLTDSDVVTLLLALGSLLVGTQLQSIGLLFVSGMIAHVTVAAAVGKRLTIGEAWQATRGKRWRLLGMALILGLGVFVVLGICGGVVYLAATQTDVGTTVLVAVVLALMLVVAYSLFVVRLRLVAVPSLMLEPVGVFGALDRAVRLTRRQFWRLFGIFLLVSLISGFAASMVRLPFSLVGQFFLIGRSDTGSGLAIYLLLTAVGTVISSALLQPFLAAVNSLLYVDQRIRKEAFDVELMSRAGIFGS
jgi:hypothetical protein